MLVTLSLERADGIERVAFRCAIASASHDRDEQSIDALLTRIAPWVERRFESVREAALKSVRSEGRLARIEIDEH